jgi:hypothetical protein
MKSSSTDMKLMYPVSTGSGKLSIVQIEAYEIRVPWSRNSRIEISKTNEKDTRQPNNGNQNQVL